MLYPPPSVDELNDPLIRRQSDFLRFAEDEGVEGSDELKRFGWSLDDLAYEIGDARKWEDGDAPTLKDLRRPTNKIPFVSFFSGCGGMDIGLRRPGSSTLRDSKLTLFFAKRSV